MNDLTKAAGTEVATASLDAWGTEAVETSDVVIPKILLMQKMSDAVDKDLAKEGDLIDSLTNEVLGSLKKPVEVIPFHREKLWFVSRMENGKWVLDEIVDFNADNQNWRYNDTVGGIEYKRELHMRYYVLRTDDLSLPYIVSFKSMSLASGKALYTQMYVKNRQAGKVPCAYTILLGGHKKENDKGKFCVLDFELGREATNEEVQTAFQWFQTVKDGAKVDDDAPATAVADSQYADASAQF